VCSRPVAGVLQSVVHILFPAPKECDDLKDGVIELLWLLTYFRANIDRGFSNLWKTAPRQAEFGDDRWIHAPHFRPARDSDSTICRHM